MANEFKHKDPCISLTQAEYISACGDGHIFACQATGDILYASSSTVLSKLAKGAANTVLSMGGSCIPAWTASPSVTDLTIGGGCITLSAATDIDLLDNNASALSFDASGKTGIIDIVTTNCSEGVTMSGTLGVTINGTTIGHTCDTDLITVADQSVTIAGDLAISGGCITLTGAATDIDLIDNNASALSFDASGKTGIIDIVTTDCSEGVTMSGTLGVTGVLTATGGIELSHACQNTLTGSSGCLSIQGNVVYRAGGTDVPVADGGTGLSCLTTGSVLIGTGASDVTLVAMVTKGHLLAGDGSGAPRALGIGSNCQVLTACSGETTGMKWACASGGGLTACGALCFNRSAQNTGGNPFARVKISNSNAITANTGTTQRITSLWVEEPNISESGGTVTNTSAIFVEGPATEGCNNWAINIDSGLLRSQGIHNTNGCACNPTYTFADDPDLGMYRIGSNKMGFAGNSGERIRFDMAGGATRLGLEDSDPGGGTVVLRVCQGANDDDAFSIGSSDVCHAMSAQTASDTYFRIRKQSASAGGAILDGFRDCNGGAYGAIWLRGNLGEAACTGKSTGSYGIVTADSRIRSGTSATTVGTDGNLFSISSNTCTKFIFDREGTAHADVGTATYDDYCDVELLRGLLATTCDQYKDNYVNKFGQDLMYNQQWYEDNKILGRCSIHYETRECGRVQQRAMINFTGLTMLHHSTIIQLADRLYDRIDGIETQLKALTEGK